MKNLLAIFALTLMTSQAMAAKLDLVMSGFSGKPAKIFYAIIENPKQFPDGASVKNGTMTISGTEASVTISVQLPPGSYAISTFLDENGNNKMDKKLGIPSEKFAFSNNPKLKFGPPSFSECEVRVQDGVKNAAPIKLKVFKNHLGV